MAASFATRPQPRGDANATFEALGKRYLDEFGRYTPVSATALGDHRYDGDLDDLGAAGRAGTLAWNEALLADLRRIDRSKLSRENQVDAAVLDNQLRYAIWTEQQFRDWSWDPLVYTQLAGQSLYGLLARDFAPLPDRLRSVTSRLEKLPRLLEQERANLVPERVPAIHAETAIKQNPGVLSLVDELVVPTWGRCRTPNRRGSSPQSRPRGLPCRRTRNGSRPNSCRERRGDFRIGRDLYDQKLGVRAHVPALAPGHPLACRGGGRPDAQRNVRRREAGAGRTAGRSCPAGRAGPGPAAGRDRGRARAGVRRPARSRRRRRLRTRDAGRDDRLRAREEFRLDAGEPLEIILMPVFQRGVAVAYCDSPGPLDKGQRTFYAVSPIPADWTEAQVDSFLREYNKRSIANLTDPRSDARSLPADRALEPLPVGAACECWARGRSSRAGPSTPSVSCASRASGATTR